MNDPVVELSQADQELSRIKEQQEQLRLQSPFNPLAHLAYEMGTVVEMFQAAKIRNLENKCKAK